LTQTIFLLFATVGVHLLVFIQLLSYRRAGRQGQGVPSLVFIWGLIALTLLLACRALFPAWLALGSGLYDFTDAVFSFAAALSLMVVALALGSGRTASS
jgi:hypothetical protein